MRITEDNLRFTEIEHKFVVDDNFDLEVFRDTLARLKPSKIRALRVRDRYFLLEGSAARKFIIRHRFDQELHHLTVKTIDRDPELRGEVNLDLGHHVGDQKDQVEAFLGHVGIVWSGTLNKNMEVWYFPDSEVVYYEASTDSRVVRCVEFEAVRKDSVEDALATLSTYERLTGFDKAVRSRLSLPQMLFPEIAIDFD